VQFLLTAKEGQEYGNAFRSLYDRYTPQETVASPESLVYTGNRESAVATTEAQTTDAGAETDAAKADLLFAPMSDAERAQKAEERGRARDYFASSLRQVIQGNYADDVTLLGTALQIAVSLTGADAALDIRDLAYDITHWKWDKGHIGQTLLDAVGLIPGIGVVKNLDEAATVLRSLMKNADTLTEALAAAAKVSPEASEWRMKGIAKYGDSVTEGLNQIWFSECEASCTAARQSFSRFRRETRRFNGRKGAS